jgi:P-type Cu+ transporter
MPAASTPSATRDAGVETFFERPKCCVLPPPGGATQYLGSFISLRDGTWIRLGIAIILAGQSMVWGLAVNLSGIPTFSTVYWVLHGFLALSALLVMGLLGTDLLRSFRQSILQRRLGIESLFMLSLLGALGGSVHATLRGQGDVYYEVILVVLIIFSFGQKLGTVSKQRALQEANHYREQFNSVQIRATDGKTAPIPYCQLTTGDTFFVTPGNAISADGIITDGYGYVRETALTGEPHPISKGVGDRVHAGTWAVDATLTCRAEIPAEVA